jgi:UDPglucose 6-dehydrogenase
MQRICVVGTGYVGLVTGTCLAELGNDVHCVDVVAEKIARLRAGELPIYEPWLDALVQRNATAGRLHFTTSYAEAVPDADLIFIAVNTPTIPGGMGVDMRFVEAVARSVAERLVHDAIIINKSTMPVGSGEHVAAIVREHLAHPAVNVAVVANPEFLREGSAVQDFLHPDRIVLGAVDRATAERVAQLYLPLRAPIVLTDLHTAEMIKYASNAFLATKISFINEIARICDLVGADVREVAAGMGHDRRIGPAFLDAGLGYGGSCLSKDLSALAHMAQVRGLRPQLLDAVMRVNTDQRHLAVECLEAALGGGLRGKRIAVLGLAFKDNTDDIRDAPALDIITWLIEAGAAEVRAYDPRAAEAVRRVLPADWPVRYCADEYDAAAGCEGLIVVADWKRFRDLSATRLRAAMHGEHPVIIDGRNLFDPERMYEAGFRYMGIGRGNRVRSPVSADVPSAVHADMRVPGEAAAVPHEIPSTLASVAALSALSSVSFASSPEVAAS